MIAVFLSNTVPYHHARWNAYASLASDGCLLIETTDRDAFRVLEYNQKSSTAYKRLTLFPGESASTPSKQNLRRAIYRSLDEHRPDLVCVNGYSMPQSWLALDWGLRRNVPIVVCSESNEFDDHRTAWKEWIKKLFVRHCSAGLAGGSPQADYLIKLGLAPGRTFKGYDVVDNMHFEFNANEARKNEAQIRTKLNLPAKYFVACARFAPKKNLYRLIEAFGRYYEHCTSSAVAPWDLVIIGDGDEQNNLLSLRSTLGLEKTVHMTGAQSYTDIPTYYGLASAFIHASTTEQWGLVVNEAMACGLPVLVSHRCGCAQDLVKEGINGFTFDPYDVDDIAQKMVQLSTSDHHAATFGRASQKIIADWSPLRFAEGFSQAVKTAFSSQPIRPTWINQALIRILAHR